MSGIAPNPASSSSQPAGAPSAAAQQPPVSTTTAALNAKDKALLDRIIAARENAISAPTPQHAQRQWSEVTVAFDRLIQQRKLALCASISNDACAFWSSIVDELLSFATARCLAATTADASWLEVELAVMHEHGLFAVVQHCCDPKFAVAMVGEALHRNLISSVCAAIAARHLAFFTKVYTTFCDACKRTCSKRPFNATTPADPTITGDIDARVVDAVRSVMNLVLTCCTNGDEQTCTALTQSSEPAALISKFLYGLKLRSQHSQLFCPVIRVAPSLSGGSTVLAETTTLNDTVATFTEGSLTRDGSGGLIRRGSSVEPKTPVVIRNLSSPDHKGGEESTTTTHQFIDPHSPNPTQPQHASTTQEVDASPGPSETQMRPLPGAHETTPIDFIHAQALEVLVEIVRRKRTRIADCPSCSTVVLNLCSYVSVNVHMAEPESTHDDCLAILYNVQTLLRALKAMMVDTLLPDNRYAVIEEVLKENQGESMLELVRLLIVRVQTCMQADLAVLDALHNFLLVAAPLVGQQQKDHPFPKPSSASELSPPSVASTFTVGGASVPAPQVHIRGPPPPPLAATQQQQQHGHGAIADRVKSLLGSSFDPMSLLARSSHNTMIAQTPRDGSEGHSFTGRHSDSSLNTSFTGVNGGGPFGETHGQLQLMRAGCPEHTLCKATLSVLAYFAKSSHILPSIRAVACEWIRSFVFGLTATVPIDALPADIQDDPIEFFLSVARDGEATTNATTINATATPSVLLSSPPLTPAVPPLPSNHMSLHSKHDRTYLLSCSFHGLHSLFHHAHRVPRPAQLDAIATLVISSEVVQSPRLLSQTLLVWSSCLSMLVHHRPVAATDAATAAAAEGSWFSFSSHASGTAGSGAPTARGQSEASLSFLLQHIVEGTLIFSKEGSVELPPGECGVDPARWESSVRRVGDSSSWCVDLNGTSPVQTAPEYHGSAINNNYSAATSHENSLAPGTQSSVPGHLLHHTTTASHLHNTTAHHHHVSATAVSLLELISKVTFLVLSSTLENTSDELIVSILGLLEARASSGGSSSPLFGSAASSPNMSRVGGGAATSLVSFADRCVMSLVHTSIPRAMPFYVDTLANPRLAAAFLPYLLQVFEVAMKSSRRLVASPRGSMSSPLRSSDATRPLNDDVNAPMTAVLRAFAQADGVSVATSIIADILRDGDDAALLQQLFQLIGPYMSPVYAIKEYSEEVEKVTHELVLVARREEAQAALGQTILDASVGKSSFSLDNVLLSGSNSDNRLSASLLHCTGRGPFMVREPDCAACHPHYLDLVPPLLSVMLEMGHTELHEAYLEALFLIVEATGQVRSIALLNWAIANGRTTFLRHLHIPLPLLNGLPFTKTSVEMRKFWAPLLRQAPRRSALRFHGHGGITVSVDSWPEAGLSISCWFMFHEIYPTLPLFEIIGVSENSTPVDDAVSIEGGETIAVHHNASATAAAAIGATTGGTVHKKRSILNEDTALAGLEPRRWLHFTLVISPARVMTLYFYGRVVGSSAVPSAIVPESHAQIHLGLVTKQRDSAFFSLGEVQLWNDELTAPQVLADYCGSDPQPFAPKLLPADVPREWMLATVTSAEAATLSRMPMASRVARFEPHSIARRGTSSSPSEHQQINLCGHLADNARPPVTAHIQYGVIAPPFSFVHFHRLFLSRGGLRYLAQWVDGAKSEADLTEALQLFAECVRVVHMSETMRPRLYTLVGYFLKRNIRSFLSKEGAMYLVRLAMVLVPSNELMHAVVINRMAFDHLLCDMDLILEMRQEVAVAYIAELSRNFDTSVNKCAKRNFEYILGRRVFDKVLHGCVRISPGVSRVVHIALVEFLRHLLLASDCHLEVLSSILHIVAVLTPQNTLMDSLHRPTLTISVPQESRVTSIALPFRLMHFLCVRLLRLVIDVIALGGAAATRVYSLVTVPWYLAIVQSPFASTSTVVLATRLMADAVAMHQPLTAEFKQHLYIISCALEAHAYDTNVVVFLLAAAVGLHVKINLADAKRGILKQLDDVMASSKTDVRPVFSALFAATFAKHLHLVSDGPRLLYREQHCHWPFSQHLSWRTRKFFSAVKVVGLLMLRVNAKRYARRRKTQPGTGELNNNNNTVSSALLPSLTTSLDIDAKFVPSGTSSLQQQQSVNGPMPHHDDPLHLGSPGDVALNAGVFPSMSRSVEASIPAFLTSNANSAFPTFRAATPQNSSVTPTELVITAPSGYADHINDMLARDQQYPQEIPEPELLSFAPIPAPAPITAAELFLVGHMKPLTDLPPYFRRAMTKLLVIVRCFRLPLMHTRYDAYNNRMRLRQQAAAKDGLPCIAATREIAEPTLFLLSATKSLAAHTNMFPVFAGGILQHDLIAFLASMESVRSERLLSANHIPPVDLASVAPTAAAAPAAPTLVEVPASNASTASLVPEEALLSGSYRAKAGFLVGESFTVDDAAQPVSLGALPVIIDASASDAGSAAGDAGISGVVAESISVWYDDDDSASDAASDAASDREHGRNSTVVESFMSTAAGAGTVFTEDSNDHFSLEQLFENNATTPKGSDSSFASPLAPGPGERASTFQTIALQNREAVAAHARDILGVIVRTSLCAHDSVKLWGEYAKLQSDGKDHLQFLFQRYGPCGTLLAHCLTSFLGTTASIKEDSFRITMIFCAALAPILRDLQDYYAYLQMSSSTNSTMVPPTPASGPTDLAGTITDSKGGPSLSSLNSGTQAIPALGLPAPVTGTAATTQSSSAPAAPHSLSMLAMKQNEPAIVKNLVLFIVFLCDRVVTNILSFEAVLPFLLMALRAAEKSTTQMCDASADQAMSASARKDLNSTTLRITAGQLIRSQILRVVVILLSLQEPSPSLLEHILVALKATMQRDHEPRQLDELMRVLYTAFKTPPVRHFEQVQLLLAAIWQFIHNTCALSPRFKKATTLKGLTQVLSLTKEIGAACTGGTAADVRVRLELLFRERREDLDSVFSARPKSKFDDAVRREHRMKKDYQEHIPAIASARKIFRTPFSTALVVTESYWSLYGSMADALEPVSHHNAHWLYFTNNAVHGTPYDEERYRLASVESFRVLSKKRKNTVLVSEPIPMVTVTGEDNDDDDDSDGDDGADVDLFGATIYPSSSALLGGSGATFQLPPLDVESLTTANATPLTATDAATTGGGVCTPLSNGAVAILGVTPGKLKQRHYYDTARNYVPFLLAVDDEEDGEGDCTLRAAARSASIVDASVCEEMTSVMSVFCPAFICRCPPIPMRDDHNRMFHPECTTHFTDSARFLLRYLLSPGERVRHICNAFRVDGIHSTPCVVILTDAMLKVYASARITGHGDILIGGDELLEEVDLEEDIAVSASSSSSHLTTHHASLPKSSGLTPKGSPTAALKRGGLSTSFRGLEKFARRTTQRIQNRVKSIFTGTERKRIRGSRLARSLHASVHGSTSAMRGLCWFYYNNNITKLQKVQYMHQDCALLVSLAHDNGPLLAIMDDSQSLNNTARDQFYSVIKKILVSSQIAGNVAFLDEVSKKPLLEVATERWVHRSCSTYEYLLTLNSIANRVRKDWNQYPVFPWVLKNYTSGTTLDLNAADNYRDLSWPIGAQLEQRREELKVRYDTLQETSQQERLDYEAENPGSNTGASGTSTLLNVIISRVEEVATGMPSESTGAGPLGVRTYPFHHGSHYSSSAGVLHYLIRTEPFTTRSKIYQGGSFDHPDRLFHSVQDSFYSCTHSSADCKELIPEFYSRGQFLANEDGRKFGARQDGRVVDAVTLPPWAQESPHVFVAVMRMALESEHVSQRLHKWIDLVFGVRQQGKLSIESFNVFQRFSYGEEVLRALGATHSIQECKAIVSEVENFGQTPVQVFTDAPHPQRRNAAFRQPSSAVVSASSSISSAAALSATGALGDTQAALYDTGSLAGTVDQGSLTSSTLGTTVLTSTTNGGAPAFPEEAPLDATTTPLEDLGLSSTITARPTTLQVLFTHAQRYTMEEDLATVTYHATTATTQVAQLEDTNSGRGGIVFVPPPPSQTSRFILADPASGTFTQPHHNMVARFAGATRNTKPIVSIVPLADGKLFADTDQMRLIPETDLCLCWYKHEERLLRYRVSTGEFHSAVQFEIPEGHEEMEITSVVACRREVFLCLGTSSGTIYCLHPDSIRSWCVLGTTLCVHTNPIRFMVASERLSRLVSVTNNVNDPPIVWRIQRLLVAKLHHIPMDLVTPETDRLVTGVCMCPREGNTFVSTTRRVAVFDSDGTPWGVGKLPSPADADSTVLTVFADITSMHQFLTSDWCDGRVAVLTGHTDGSIGLWCIRRNPPSSIAPHAIVSVKFVRLVAPTHPAAFGYPTTFRQPVEGTPHIFIGYSSGLLRELRFEESFLVAGNNSVAGQASGATGSSAAQK